MRRLAAIALNVVAIAIIALGIARVLGTIPFAPWATDSLIRFAAWFGAYGDEQVENVYVLASLLVAFIFAAALVWATRRLLARRHGQPPRMNRPH